MPRGPGRRRREGRDPHRRRLVRRDPRAGGQGWRPGAAHPAARARTGLHRLDPLRAGPVHRHGRRRLHLRLPQAGAVRRGDAQRHRVRHGLAVEGLASSPARCHRCTSTSARRSRPGSSTGSTAATSPTSTAACAASPATRWSGWAGVPVLGVRLRDGAQVGPDGAGHQRGPGDLPQGPGGPALATTSGPAGSRRSRRPGSTCARCSSTARSSSSSSLGSC